VLPPSSAVFNQAELSTVSLPLMLQRDATSSAWRTNMRCPFPVVIRPSLQGINYCGSIGNIAIEESLESTVLESIMSTLCINSR
jgi:hypothetical protein